MFKNAALFAAFTLSTSAIAAPTVTVSGECTGVVDIEVTGITPFGTIAIVHGHGAEGAGDTIPRGPCAGVESDLTTLRYVFSVTDYDGDGNISFSPTIGNEAVCGTFFQMIDMETCEPSNLEMIPWSDADYYYYDELYEYYDEYYDLYHTDPCEEAGGTLDWIADGWCDDSNNIDVCDYDGGDCCYDTCEDSTYGCGVAGFDCLDPYASGGTETWYDAYHDTYTDYTYTDYTWTDYTWTDYGYTAYHTDVGYHSSYGWDSYHGLTDYTGHSEYYGAYDVYYTYDWTYDYLSTSWHTTYYGYTPYGTYYHHYDYTRDYHSS